MRTFLRAVLLAIAVPAIAADSITCTGTWAPTVTEHALVKAFGRANVVRGMIYLAEGAEERGTIVFPKDDKRRLEIIWKKNKRPEWIRIPEGSGWTTFGGIRIGTKLAEVEKLNGRAFQLSGFDWDYGGFVTDSRGGKLDTIGGPCRLQLRFDRNVPGRPTRAQEKAIDATSGDRELLSTDRNLRMFPVTLGEIIIQYP